MGIETVYKEISLIFEAVDQWNEEKLFKAASKRQTTVDLLPVWAFERRANVREVESYLTRLIHLAQLLPETKGVRHKIVLAATKGLLQIGSPIPYRPVWNVIVSHKASLYQRSSAGRLWCRSLFPRR